MSKNLVYPTPWMVPIDQPVRILDARGCVVVVFEHPETTSAEDRANARRIVEAVNAWPPRSSRFS